LKTFGSSTWEPYGARWCRSGKGTAITRLLILLAVGAAVAAGPAYAKGPTTAVLCGLEECESLGSGEGLRSIAHGYGGPLAETPAPAPYFELRFTSRAEDGDHTWITWYVHSAGMFAALSDGESPLQDGGLGVYWMRIQEPRLMEAAECLEPFPTPEITAVTIGERRITADAGRYLELVTVETTDRNPEPPGVGDWLPITFVSKQRSPWTATESGLKFAPARGMLSRGVELVKLPDAVAAELRIGKLSTEPRIPSRTLLVLFLGALSLLGAALVRRPLRRQKTA
jgi:hypothetical protein